MYSLWFGSSMLLQTVACLDVLITCRLVSGRREIQPCVNVECICDTRDHFIWNTKNCCAAHTYSKMVEQVVAHLQIPSPTPEIKTGTPHRNQ